MEDHRGSGLPCQCLQDAATTSSHVQQNGCLAARAYVVMTKRASVSVSCGPAHNSSRWVPSDRHPFSTLWPTKHETVATRVSVNRSKDNSVHSEVSRNARVTAISRCRTLPDMRMNRCIGQIGGKQEKGQTCPEQSVCACRVKSSPVMPWPDWNLAGKPHRQ